MRSESFPYFHHLGLIWTIVIISLWVWTFFRFLSLDLVQLSPLQWAGVVGIRTFLHTGLFILAHDAMHGSLIPTHAIANQTLGKLALGLYAVLPYDRCKTNHHQHHQTPGQQGDPDFHNGIHRHPMLWYVQFLSAYLSTGQMMAFLAIVGTVFANLIFLFHISILNCILVWMMPLILSSIQLFYFGTYLPHRNETLGPQSSYYPKLISLLICYHFSYHQEHHLHPEVAWYRLPECKS